MKNPSVEIYGKSTPETYQTCNMEIIRLAQQMFNFVLPSELIEKPGSCML